MSYTPKPVITISAPSGVLVSLIPNATMSETPQLGVGTTANLTLNLKPY